MSTQPQPSLEELAAANRVLTEANERLLVKRAGVRARGGDNPWSGV